MKRIFHVLLKVSVNKCSYSTGSICEYVSIINVFKHVCIYYVYIQHYRYCTVRIRSTVIITQCYTPLIKWQKPENYHHNRVTYAP